jgi:SpoVK/Ycf46/Vps4 family AAA+-type ATPase
MSSITQTNIFRYTVRVLAWMRANVFRFDRLLGTALLATDYALITLPITRPSLSFAQDWKEPHIIVHLSRYFNVELTLIYWFGVLTATTGAVLMAIHRRPFASKFSAAFLLTICVGLLVFRTYYANHHTVAGWVATSLSTGALLGLFWYGFDTLRNGLTGAVQRTKLVRRLGLLSVFLLAPSVLADPIALYSAWRGSAFIQLHDIGVAVGAAALSLLGYHFWIERQQAVLNFFKRARNFFGQRIFSIPLRKRPAMSFTHAKPYKQLTKTNTERGEEAEHDAKPDAERIPPSSTDEVPKQYLPRGGNDSDDPAPRWPGDVSVPYNHITQAAFYAKQDRSQNTLEITQPPELNPLPPPIVLLPPPPPSLPVADFCEESPFSYQTSAKPSARRVHGTSLPTNSESAINPSRSFPGVDANHPNFPTFPQKRIEDLIGLDAFRNELLAIGEEVFAPRPQQAQHAGHAQYSQHTQYRQQAHHAQNAQHPGSEEKTEPIAPRNGILFFGPPGNGKTTFAEALAASFKKPLITLTIGEATSMWVGQTTEQIRAAFALAHTISPCVLFIDEIDAFLVNRAKITHVESETAKITNQLLTEIVNLRKTGSLIIGATNHFDLLDPAAIRDGRFDFKREVPAPDAPARLALLRGVNAMTAQQRRIPQRDLEQVADRLVGLSVSRLVRLADDAKRWLRDPANTAETLTAKRWRLILRSSQPSKGDAINQDAKPLSALILPDRLRNDLAGLADQMDRMEEIEHKGGALPRGLVFAGPPGTGKTAAAMALAKAADWSFLGTSGSAIIGDLPGFKALVAKAGELRPCVVLIDEGDVVLRTRVQGDPTALITTALLDLMDGAKEPIRDVLFVLCTNFAEQLDPAVTRGKRFSKQLLFTAPAAEHLKRAADHWVQRKGVQLDPAFDLHAVCAALAHNQLSIATLEDRLQEALNEAARMHAGRGQTVVGLHALARHVGGANQ